MSSRFPTMGRVIRRTVQALFDIEGGEHSAVFGLAIAAGYCQFWLRPRVGREIAEVEKGTVRQTHRRNPTSRRRYG